MKDNRDSTELFSEREKRFKQAVREARSSLWRRRSGRDRSDEAVAQATLARLREAAGRPPEKDPVAWQLVLEQVIHNFPQDCIGKGDAPSVYEQAAFDALTLYALHQRGLAVEMYEARVSVGTAVARLANVTDSKSIKQRFDAVMTAVSPGAVDHHLRGLISLLNSHEIPLDYGELALDLVKINSSKRSGAVRLRWGRDFAYALDAAYGTSKKS